MEIIEFKGEKYPFFQSQGFAAEHAFSYAKKVCFGRGLDVGCGKYEWCLPGALAIDVTFKDGFYHALNLPEGEFDYIFSSHCIEHVDNWVDVLDYWETKIKSGGTLFLYLPHYSQKYWRIFENRKHIHTLSPGLIKDYLESRGCWKNIFASKRDLNNSFMVMAEKI